MTWSTACASVIVGLLLSTRIVKNRTGPWLLDLHRFLGGISVIFLIGHMVTLYFDSYVDFGARELLIPGESTWNAEAAAWGVIAAWTLVIVEVTSILRKRISTSVWRMFHMLSIVTVAAGSYHAWLGGSDIDNPLTWLIAGAGSAIVVLLVAVRLRRAGNRDHTTADRTSREALLLEMRERLESLPVLEPSSETQFDPDDAATLPRRAPATGPFDDPPLQPGQIDIESPEPPTPAGDDRPEWTPTETPADAPLDLFGTSRPPLAVTEPSPFGSEPAPIAAAPDVTPTNLFGEPPTFSQPDSSPPAFDAGSPFGSEAPPAQPAPVNPFRPIEPTTQSIAVEVPSTPSVDPAAASVAATPDLHEETVPALVGAALAPPPLPENAVDPVTGEPDRAAYQAWLVEWLAYAEKYGEETPDDPNRI